MTDKPLTAVEFEKGLKVQMRDLSKTMRTGAVDPLPILAALTKALALTVCIMAKGDRKRLDDLSMKAEEAVARMAHGHLTTLEEKSMK